MAGTRMSLLWMVLEPRVTEDLWVPGLAMSDLLKVDKQKHSVCFAVHQRRHFNVNVIFRLRQTENSVLGPLISICLRRKRKCYFPSEPDGHLERSWAVFPFVPCYDVLSYLITPPKPLFYIRVLLRSSVVLASRLLAFYAPNPCPTK